MADGDTVVDLSVGDSSPLQLRDYRRLARLYCMNGGHHLQILPDGTVQGQREESDAHSKITARFNIQVRPAAWRVHFLCCRCSRLKRHASISLFKWNAGHPTALVCCKMSEFRLNVFMNVDGVGGCLSTRKHAEVEGKFTDRSSGMACWEWCRRGFCERNISGLEKVETGNHSTRHFSHQILFCIDQPSASSLFTLLHRRWTCSNQGWTKQRETD